MELPTSIGTIVVESDWAPLLHFLELRRTPFPPYEDRKVLLRVELVDEVVTEQDDPADAYPRRLYVQSSRFLISRDGIQGWVPKGLTQVGVLIEWIWYALAVCCAPEGWEPVHAAAVERGGEAAIIFGDNGAGKTRTAMRMMQSGWRYFSDDIVLVNGQGTVVRGWGNTNHADPRVAAEFGQGGLTLDFAGKVQIIPPAPPATNLASLKHIYLVGDAGSPWHDGPGFESDWVRALGVGARLLQQATDIPSDRLDAKVIITNRNTGWFGGDQVHAAGYVEGLQSCGVDARYVPCDQLDPKEKAIVQLMHLQFDWSRQVAERVRGPLVVAAITQGTPSLDDVAPVAKAADRILCYSDLEERFLSRLLPSEPRAKFVSVPLGVSEEIFATTAESPGGVFVAARYCPTKNQEAVLSACRALNVPVTFAGQLEESQGAYVAKLRRLSQGWRGARFLGMLRGEALWRRYAECHVHVQASLWESFGLSTWEAMAAGCNIVVTRNGFGRPWFEPHGSLCDPTPASIKEALEHELRLPRGRHKFRPPTWKQVARALIPIYQDACNATPA